MGVNRPHQVFHGALKLHGGYRLGDQFRSLGTDDVYAKDFTVACIGDKFDEALMLAHDGSARIRGKWEFSYFYVVALLPGFGLGQPHAANFWMAERHIGNAQGIDRLVLFAGDLGDGDDALHAAYVSQLRSTENNVADGVNSRFGSLHPLVGSYKPTFALDPGFLQANVFGIRRAPDGNEDFLSLLSLLFAASAEGHRHP